MLRDRLCHGMKGLRFVPVWRFTPNLRVVTLPPHATARTEQHRETPASWMRFGRSRAQHTQGRSHFGTWWQHQPVLFFDCHAIKYPLLLLVSRFSSQSRSLKVFTPGCYWARNGSIWNVYAGGKLDHVQPDVLCLQSQIQTQEQAHCYFACNPILKC